MNLEDLFKGASMQSNSPNLQEVVAQLKENFLGIYSSTAVVQNTVEMLTQEIVADKTLIKELQQEVQTLKEKYEPTPKAT